jgi:hypothetical protein
MTEVSSLDIFAGEQSGPGQITKWSSIGSAARCGLESDQSGQPKGPRQGVSLVCEGQQEGQEVCQGQEGCEEAEDVSCQVGEVFLEEVRAQEERAGALERFLGTGQHLGEVCRGRRATRRWPWATRSLPRWRSSARGSV